MAAAKGVWQLDSSSSSWQHGKIRIHEGSTKQRDEASQDYDQIQSLQTLQTTKHNWWPLCPTLWGDNAA